MNETHTSHLQVSFVSIWEKTDYVIMGLDCIKEIQEIYFCVTGLPAELLLSKQLIQGFW